MTGDYLEVITLYWCHLQKYSTKNVIEVSAHERLYWNVEFSAGKKSPGPQVDICLRSRWTQTVVRHAYRIWPIRKTLSLLSPLQNIICDTGSSGAVDILRGNLGGIRFHAHVTTISFVKLLLHVLLPLGIIQFASLHI